MEPTNQGERPQEVAKLSQVTQIDEGKIQEHLGGVVRSAVEVRSDVGRGKTASRRRHEVGHASLSGHEPPRRSERSRMIARAKTFGAPLGGAEHHQTLRPNKCAKNSGHYPRPVEN
jgi:hypothetical protein